MGTSGAINAIFYIYKNIKLIPSNLVDIICGYKLSNNVQKFQAKRHNESKVLLFFSERR